MLVIGIICLIIAYLLGIPILNTIGIILVVIGGVLLVAGALGHPVGPRRYYW